MLVSLRGERGVQAGREAAEQPIFCGSQYFALSYRKPNCIATVSKQYIVRGRWGRKQEGVAGKESAQVGPSRPSRRSLISHTWSRRTEGTKNFQNTTRRMYQLWAEIASNASRNSQSSYVYRFNITPQQRKDSGNNNKGEKRRIRARKLSS